ncbi:MAG: S49 family peptidase [Rhodospirillales bacterium]|nr:S49 family peptidase [Rhodospirillales bacterium]
MRLPSPRNLVPVRRYREPAPVVGVLRLAGVIGQTGPWRKGLSLATLAGPIERVFKLKHLKAVALAINSPGGSPVQSALIARRVRAMADEKEIPVVAFAEDVAASGGYWLACAADEIFADENSIVGSIGVISGGFGFPELLKRIGVERRLHTAGERKAILDPFSREKAEDVEHLREIQGDIHDSFKTMVRDRRGKKLKAPDEELFSGAFWTGRKAADMGLIDGIGDLRSVMRERFGEKVKLRLVGAEKSWVRRRFGFSGPSWSGSESADWAGGLLAAVEERMLWNRFGL